MTKKKKKTSSSSSLRRLFFACFSPSSAATSSPSSAAPTAKKRLSTSLRDDAVADPPRKTLDGQDPEADSSDSDSSSSTLRPDPVPPRRSHTMVTCTLFGLRSGCHVMFCVQPDRLSTRAALLLQLPISARQLVKEIQCGSVRVTLETGFCPGPLRSVPSWVMCCNGRRLGYAVRKKASEANKMMLGMMKSVTVGAGVIPVGSGPEKEEVVYMRASYESVVGGPDSESFHLVSPDQGPGPGQELSVFLLRST